MDGLVGRTFPLGKQYLGAKKSKKIKKNHEKIENFQIFKIDRNVKIWSNGCQFWPKNQLFCKIFTFLAWVCTGRAPSTWENTYAFSAAGPKKSKKTEKIMKKSKIFDFSKSIQK